MKKLGISFLFLFLFVPFVQAQKCDCTITPFEPKPKCFDECTTKLLASLKPLEFELIFGLKKSSAAKVGHWDGRRNAKTLEDYMSVLTVNEVGDLMKTVDSLNKDQVDFLFKPSEQREDLMKDKKFRDLFALKDGQVLPPEER